MAWTDFYMNTATGSNNNAGSTSSGTPIFSDTGGNGSWDGTSVYTPTSGVTPASAVTAGDWCSIYTSGPTNYIAKVASVAAGVNGAITLSTVNKFGTAPTSSAVANCIDGGCFADFGIMASGAAFQTGTVTQDTRLNVKAGTYANTTTSRTCSLVGSNTVGWWIRGYNSSPGDMDGVFTGTAGTTIPSITFTNANFTFSGSGFRILSNLDFVSTDNGNTVGFTVGNTQAYQIRCRNTQANAAAGAMNFGGNGAYFAGCYFSATTTASKCINGNATVAVVGCIFNGGIIGFNANICIVDNCIFYGQAGDCINVNTNANPLIITNNSFYSPTGNGINMTGIGTGIIANNYFSTVNQASKAAINNTSGGNTQAYMLLSNAYFNCTSNISGFMETFAVFDKGTLASEAFTTPASQNFNILTVGQGIGYPGSFENLSTTTSYLDVSAAQHQGSGGGATYIFQVES